MSATLNQRDTSMNTNITKPLWGLFVLAVIATLYFASDLLVPIAFAVMLSFLFSPVVRAMQRRHVPPAISAFIIIVAIVWAVGFALNGLAGPAESWLRDAPKSLRELQYELSHSEGRLADIQDLAEEVDQLAEGDPEPGTQPVVVKGPGVLDNLVVGLPAVTAFAGVVIFLTFFLLASGDSLLRRVTRCGRTWAERRRIVLIARQIQTELAVYLSTVTIINAALGGAVALVMHLMDVPNPLLWGATAALLNFAPYVGALATTVLLALVGLTTFDTLGQAFAVPAAFLALTVLEGQVFTPAVLGHRMSLSPIFVFLSVIAWGWLWGVAGALMAVPIVTSVKVVCDHVPGLAPVSEFLRRNAAPRGQEVEPVAQPQH